MLKKRMFKSDNVLTNIVTLDDTSIMVKKVKVDKLKPGMYIHDINCSWLEHPFFGNSLKVQDDEIIEKIIRSGIREVYIDTEKGLDIAGVPTKEEVDSEVQEEINKTDELDFDVIQPVSVSEEINRARKVRKEAMQSVQNVINNIKMGNQLQTEIIEHIVDDIIVSQLRNPDALVSLGMLRKTDEYLYHHSISVCALMVTFGKYLGFDPRLLREAGLGAMLHDIGTVKIPQKILSKKSALTDDEYEHVKSHVEHGRIILEKTEGITDISMAAAYQHHERFDGTGYPNGLRGSEISYVGQVIGIVDVYDALTTKRCFRRMIVPTEAIRMIYDWSDTKFNGELVQKFIRCIGIYPVGSLVRLESGLLGVVVDHSEKNLLQPVVRIIYDTAKDKKLMPYTVDLSNPLEKGSADRIISHESPDKWDLRPDIYL